MNEKLASFVLRQVNRTGRVRDAVYLDTNAWSILIKRQVSFEPLKLWVQRTGHHIWLAKFQIAELVRDTRLALPFAELLRNLPVVMLDRDQNEFQGQPWHKVEIYFDEYIHLTDQALVDEFERQMLYGPFRDVAAQTVKDGESFRLALEQSLGSVGGPSNWTEFPKRLEGWVRAKCSQQGIPVDERALNDPQCYVGLKLSFGVLFLRYLMNRQRWRTSDYIDYLHVADMAYARVAVTEKNLGECIRQLAKRPELTTPEVVADLRWIENPIG